MKNATPKRKESDFKEVLRQQKWLTLIGLPILMYTTFIGTYSVWGLLFVFWGLTSVKSGSVYLLEPIEREEDPALFWIISVMWIGFGLLYVLTDFYPEYLL